MSHTPAYARLPDHHLKKFPILLGLRQIFDKNEPRWLHAVDRFDKISFDDDKYTLLCIRLMM